MAGTGALAVAGTSPVRHAPSTASTATAPFDVKLIDATLRCVARWGVAKTTLEDVAREAGCSRATVYRTFPGGKDALLDAVLDVEVARFLDRIRVAVDPAPTLEVALVAIVGEAGRTIAGHPALQYLLTNEPELVLPRLAFGELDRLFEQVRAVGGPLLARFVDGDETVAARVAEWVARVTLSYTLSPSPDIDTTDDACIHALITTFVLPGIHQLGAFPT